MKQRLLIALIVKNKLLVICLIFFSLTITAQFPTGSTNLSDTSGYGEIRNKIDNQNLFIKLDSNNVDAYLRRAGYFIQLRNFKAAISDYTRILLLQPNKKFVYTERGNCKSYLMDVKGALEDFKKELDLDRKNYKSHYNVGRGYYMIQEYNKSITSFDTCIQLNPSWAQCYSDRSLVKKHLKKYGEALDDCNKAIELYPEYPDPYLIRALIKGELGDDLSAIPDLDNLIKLAPYSAIGYYNRGTAFGRLKKYKEAINDLDRAIQLKPNYIEAYISRAGVRYFMNDISGVFEDINKAIDLDPLNPEHINTRAGYYEKTNQPEKEKADRKLYDQMIRQQKKKK